jgi:surface antigen
MSKLMIAAMVLMVAACSNTQAGYKQPVGTVLGAAAGGLAGSQIGGGTGKLVATGLGTAIGGLLGNEIGASLDRADQAYARTHGGSPGYAVASPPAYAAAPAPTYAVAPSPQGYNAPYAVPYGSSAVSSGARSLPVGCQYVGRGIWCEQSNGTFRPGP